MVVQVSAAGTYYNSCIVPTALFRTLTTQDKRISSNTDGTGSVNAYYGGNDTTVYLKNDTPNDNTAAYLYGIY
ncbi:hypothetical protein DXC51_19555 [Eisenbergiella massiliensis]|jgi:hypothetical protein|uniref:Uncharacterized protein n=1 Tax=Eisenbergiella massiliensis TaxID=1720294 RepID=A0A3E3I0F9_9FIRM|nr:hypothetical protein DXC51_19555 [Eisenbergiella massiliensis]